MAIIQIKAIGQDLIITSEPLIASGGQEVNTIEFEFNDEWDGMAKTAIFYDEKDKKVYNVVLYQNKCTIPQEVLVNDGKIIIGVFGINGTKRLPSETVCYRVVKGSFIEGEAPELPTEDIYTQLMDKYALMEALCEEIGIKYQNIFDNLAETVADMPAKGFINVNTGKGVISIWVGTKTEKEALDEELEGVIYVTTDEEVNYATNDDLIKLASVMKVTQSHNVSGRTGSIAISDGENSYYYYEGTLTILANSSDKAISNLAITSLATIKNVVTYNENTGVISYTLYSEVANNLVSGTISYEIDGKRYLENN